MKPRSEGFTLIELIIVMVISGVLAGTLVVFFRPAFDSYLDVGRRATLADLADSAIKGISRDIRSAVPNSFVLIDPNRCFALVPTSAGALYRTAPDQRPGAPATFHFNPLVPNATDQLDLLTPTGDLSGQFIVINNLNGDDVYSGASRAAVTTFQALSASTTPSHEVGTARIGFASTTFPANDRGGYLFVVPGNGPVVYYIHAPAEQKLYRLATAFTGSTPSSCPGVAGAAVVADYVSSAIFSRVLNQGTNADLTYVQLTLKLSQNNENVVLTHGLPIENRP